MESAQAPTTLTSAATPPIYTQTPPIYTQTQTQPYDPIPDTPFPPSPHTIDLSPLEFILGLLALVTIPALIYTFFFAIKCPSLSSSSSRHHHRRPSNPTNNTTTPTLPRDASSAFVPDVNFRTDSRVAGDCPVCLSTFCDGEEIKQLGVCKHSFHTVCIDMWLSSHSDCPVCRAKVAVKRQNPAPVRSRDTDLQQGLPDAANLV